MMVGALELEIADLPTSDITEHVAQEVIDYRLDEIPWQDGDVVVDVGAHVGMVSIYIAKQHPNITVHAFEPDPRNFANLLTNLRVNEVKNVLPYNAAVSGDGRDIELVVTPDTTNSGGSSACVSHDNGEVVTVESVTLESILTDLGDVRLLKVDCEGMEYEILEDAPLDRVDYFVGEFHRNQRLVDEGHDLDALAKKVKASVGTFLCLSVCGMAD